MPDIAANGISLHYESLGNESDPPLLLIMGLAAQMILWPDAFCQLLVDKGFRATSARCPTSCANSTRPSTAHG